MTTEKITLNMLNRKVTDLQVKLNTLRAELNNIDMETLDSIDRFVTNVLCANDLQTPAPVQTAEEPLSEPEINLRRLRAEEDKIDQLDMTMIKIEQEILHQVHVLGGNSIPWSERLNYMLENRKVYEQALTTPFNHFHLDVEDLNTLVGDLDETILDALPAQPVQVSIHSAVVAMINTIQDEVGSNWTTNQLVARLRTEIAKLLGQAA